MKYFLVRYTLSMFCLFLVPNKVFAQTVDEKIELANQELENLQALHRKIEFFLGFQEKRNEASKPFLKELELWKTNQENYKQLKKCLDELEVIVREFQQTLAEAILCSYGNKGYGQTIKLSVLAQTAQDFNALFQNVFFDEEIESSYNNKKEL